MQLEKDELKRIICDFIDEADFKNIIYDVKGYNIPCVGEYGGTIYKPSGMRELYVKILIDNRES